MNRNFLKLAISFGLSAALIAWLVRAMDWAAVGRELYSARLEYIIPAIALLVVHFILRSYRWRLLCAGGGELSIRLIFDSFFVGNLATFVLPLRVGEFIRPGFVALKSSVHFPSALAAVVIERFFDLSAVLASFALVTAALPGLPDWTVKGAQGLLVLALMILIFVSAGALLPERIRAFNRFALSVLPKALASRLEKFLNDLVDGAAVLRSPSVIFKVIILTALVWASTYLFFYVFFMVFGIEAGWSAAVAMGTIVALAVAAPSAPGFVGVYQTAGIAALALFSVASDKAGAYAILNHLVQYVMIVVYGFWVLAKSDLSLKDLKRQFVRAEK